MLETQTHLAQPIAAQCWGNFRTSPGVLWKALFEDALTVQVIKFKNGTLGLGWIERTNERRQQIGFLFERSKLESRMRSRCCVLKQDTCNSQYKTKCLLSTLRRIIITSKRRWHGNPHWIAQCSRTSYAVRKNRQQSRRHCFFFFFCYATLEGGRGNY